MSTGVAHASFSKRCFGAITLARQHQTDQHRPQVPTRCSAPSPPPLLDTFFHWHRPHCWWYIQFLTWNFPSVTLADNQFPNQFFSVDFSVSVTPTGDLYSSRMDSNWFRFMSLISLFQPLTGASLSPVHAQFTHTKTLVTLNAAPLPPLFPHTLDRRKATNQQKRQESVTRLKYFELDQFDQFERFLLFSQLVCYWKTDLEGNVEIHQLLEINSNPAVFGSKEESWRQDRKRQEPCIHTGGRTTTDCELLTSTLRRLCARLFTFGCRPPVGGALPLPHSFLHLTISDVIALNSLEYTG